MGVVYYGQLHIGMKREVNILSPMDVARYIIAEFYSKDKEIDEGVSEGISNLKLQKLLYFCQAFSLAKLGKPMFSGDIYAWKYGPVVKEVYEAYKEYKNNPLPKPESEKHSITMSDAYKKVIDKVLQTFGGYSAIRLMNITHSHKQPWKKFENKVKQGERDIVIPQKEIQKYYEPILSEQYASN